jgi:hypothetical protein
MRRAAHRGRNKYVGDLAWRSDMGENSVGGWSGGVRPDRIRARCIDGAAGNKQSFPFIVALATLP